MTFKQLTINFIKDNPILITLSMILGFSGAIFNTVGTALIIPLLLAFIGQSEILFKGGPPILQKAISLFDNFPENTKFFAMFGAVLFAIILKNASNLANTLVSGQLSRNLVKKLRLDAIKTILDVDIDYHNKNRSGDIHNRLSGEVNKTAGSIKTVVGMASTIINISVFVWFLISLSWQLTIITVLLFVVIGLLNQYFVRNARKYGNILGLTAKEYANTLFEILGGMRLIKTVSYEDQEYKTMFDLTIKREKAEFDSQINSSIQGPWTEISSILVIFTIVVSGKFIYADNIDSFSTIILTYLVLLNRLIPFINSINGQRNSLANADFSVKMVTDLLNRQNKPIMTNGQENYQGLRNKIQLENLTFSYPGNQEKVLKNIQLTIEKGKTVALVGASGAGKSTIADLVPRFYDPTEGRITIDGKDLREYDVKSLRRAIGFVSQDTFLFNKSVAYNIAYGVENATQDDIIMAAKRANAYEFIVNLPQGFDTEIGDRGVLLSGGQRQRLAIARALLRNPDILILDEATSALDTVSERLVQQAIEDLCQNRTTLVIAHRLSTVEKADQIVVLNKGEIVEIGTHQELLDQQGYYAKLYGMQFTAQKESKDIVSSNLEILGTPILKAFLQTSEQLRNRLSYQVRGGLNSVLGTLRLLNDGLFDDTIEQQELIQESYDSALELFNTIESFERKSRSLTKKY
jgi:subfamily B ATP-binding cassette protein MsbA